MDMPPPLGEIGADGIRRADKTKVRSFLGFAKYQRRYIKNCGLLCGPLNELTTDNSNGIWTSVHTMVFNRIKRDVANTRGVWHADFKLPFYVCSDGSKRGLGGYLFQMVDGEERIISYFSRSTTREEREWDTRELELLDPSLYLVVHARDEQDLRFLRESVQRVAPGRWGGLRRFDRLEPDQSGQPSAGPGR